MRLPQDAEATSDSEQLLHRSAAVLEMQHAVVCGSLSRRASHECKSCRRIDCFQTTSRTTSSHHVTTKSSRRHCQRGKVSSTTSLSSKTENLAFRCTRGRERSRLERLAPETMLAECRPKGWVSDLCPGPAFSTQTSMFAPGESAQ